MAEDDSSTKAVSMTPRETEILVAALRNVKTGDLQIEFDNLAEELGLKDGNSARTQWSKVKSKLFGKKLATTAATNADGESTAAKPKPARKTTTPKSGKKTPKSEVAVKDEEDDADGSSSATAVKCGDADGEVGGPQDAASTPKTAGTPASAASTGKKRGRKTKAEKEAEAAANGDDVGDEEDAKPVKKARKTKAEKEAEAAANGNEVGEEEDTKPVKKPRKTPVKKKTATEGEDGPEPSTPTKPKKATTRKAAGNKGPSDTPDESDQTAVVDPETIEVENAKKEKMAADAQLANNVLTGKKVVTPMVVIENGSAATKANEEPTVDADAASGKVQTEQDKEVVATVVTDVVAPTIA